MGKTMTTDRVAAPPRDCPKCGRGNTNWYRYWWVDPVASCGCGSCGHLVKMESPAPFSCFGIDLDGTFENRTPAT